MAEEQLPGPGEYEKVQDDSTIIELAIFMNEILGKDNRRYEEPHIGLTRYIQMIAEDLLSLEQESMESDLKEQIFLEVKAHLEKSSLEIQRIMKGLAPDAPEAVRHLCGGINDRLLSSCVRYQEAFQQLILFTSKRNKGQVQKAGELILQGAALLEEADSMAQKLAQEYKLQAFMEMEEI